MPAKGILSQFCCLYEERLCGKGSACSPLGRKALTGPNWEGTRGPAACPGIGSWSEQATRCAKTYKWNRREHSCCSIHPIAGLECCRPCQGHVLGHNIVKYWAPSWRLHPLGAEIRKRPSIPGLSTPHHGADTCCSIQSCDWGDLLFHSLKDSRLAGIPLIRVDSVTVQRMSQ